MLCLAIDHQRAGAHFASGLAVVAPLGIAPERRSHAGEDLGNGAGPLDDIVGAVVECVGDEVHFAVGCDAEDGHVGGGAKQAHQFDTVEAFGNEIHDRAGRARLEGHAQHFQGAFDLDCSVAAGVQGTRDATAYQRIRLAI